MIEFIEIPIETLAKNNDKYELGSVFEIEGLDNE